MTGCGLCGYVPRQPATLHVWKGDDRTGLTYVVVSLLYTSFWSGSSAEAPQERSWSCLPCDFGTGLRDTYG
jgi:hypothetical protein